VEYAAKAVENSGCAPVNSFGRFEAEISYRTAIGLRVKDGVVLAVEKLIHSKLLVPGVNRRIHTIDKHIGLVWDFTVSCDYLSDKFVQRQRLVYWQMADTFPTMQGKKLQITVKYSAVQRH
jgi:hypothetical protein